MSAFEVLSLDPAVPQIRAPGVGDTYSVPRDMTLASGTVLSAPTVDATNVEVTNVKAKDGTAAATIADSTGVVSITANPILSGGTANGVLYLNASKVATSGSALTFDGTGLFTVGSGGTGTNNGIVIADSGTGTAAGSGIILRKNSSSIGGLVSGSNFFGDTSSATILYSQLSAGLDIVSSNAAGTIRFAAGGTTTQMRLDSSGNLGLGVTPSAWTGTGVKAFQFGDFTNAKGVLAAAGTFGTVLGWNCNYDSAWKYVTSDVAGRYAIEGNAHTWYTAPSGTAGNAITFTQAMTLDASGNLLVGTTTTTNNLRLDEKFAVVKAGSNTYTGGAFTGYSGTQPEPAPVLDFNRSRGTTDGSMTAVASGDTLGYVIFRGADGTNFANGGYISGEVDGTVSSNVVPGRLVFYTSNSSGNAVERARITAGGYFKASNTADYNTTGGWHDFRSNASDNTIKFANSNASGPFGIDVSYTAAAPNGTSNFFLYCADNAAVRANIRSNGGLANYQANDVDLSDVRTKKEINPASSMWDKIGALEIVAYKYNDQTHDDVNLGVIAQQVEAVEPVWVDADGFGETPEGEEPLKTVYTKDIYFAAIKALQEAMARIENLEAEVAALKGA